MRKSLETLVNENSFHNENEEYFLTDKKVLELLKQVREATLKEAAKGVKINAISFINRKKILELPLNYIEI